MNAYGILNPKGFSSKALLAFNIIVGKVRTTNKNEFLTDCKELFVTYGIYVLDNVIVLFAKMGAFVIMMNVCQGPLSLWQRISLYLIKYKHL